MLTLRNASLSCSFDEKTGALTEVVREGVRIPFDGIGFDLGCNEKNLNGILEYDSLLENRTWNLPRILPTKAGRETPDVSAAEQGEGRAAFTYAAGPLAVTFTYTLMEGALKLAATIQNTGGDAAYLNTFSFLSRLNAVENVAFDFPCNTPLNVQQAASLTPL